MGMTQNTLFPDSPKLSPAAAEKRRDRGIEKSDAHASAEQGDWRLPAMGALKHFLTMKQYEPFLAEEFV